MTDTLITAVALVLAAYVAYRLCVEVRLRIADRVMHHVRRTLSDDLRKSGKRRTDEVEAEVERKARDAREWILRRNVWAFTGSLIRTAIEIAFDRSLGRTDWRRRPSTLLGRHMRPPADD